MEILPEAPVVGIATRPPQEEINAVRLKKASSTKAEWNAYLSNLNGGQRADVVKYTFRTKTKDFKRKSKKVYKKKTYKKKYYKRAYKKPFYRRSYRRPYYSGRYRRY